MSLHVSDQAEGESCWCKRHVRRSDPASIRIHIDDSNRLVHKEEGEASQANQTVVGRVTLSALVIEVDNALLSEACAKEEGVGDAESPRGKFQVSIRVLIVAVDRFVWLLHFQC